MSANDGLRGMAAVGSLMLSTKGRKVGGTKASRGASNAAHRILIAAGKPMNGSDITAHALGLGYWQSSAGAPINGLVHNLNTDCKSADGIFSKPSPGVFALKEGAGPSLAVQGPDTPTGIDLATYHVLILSERLEALPRVKIPERDKSIKPLAIAEYMSLPEGKTIADVDDATKSQITANAETITKIFKA